MTSLQSTLGDDVAEELAESQRAISIAEFFEKNKQMLGFDSGAKALVTAVKEGVDNALDATEEAGILPDVYVEIAEVDDYYRVVIEDNGPGITKAQIPKIFGKLLYGSRFHVREQNRGQQGIGISAAVLYAQLTSGKPAKITSRTQGSAEAQYFELIVDTDSNEPEVSVADTTAWERPHGTRIELEMEANMRARQQLHDYVKHTAVVNPHARIELKEPNAHFKFERADGAELPAETEEIRPHPHGVELGTLLKMLESTNSHSVSGFLQEEFTRVGRKTADEVVDRFTDRHYGRAMTWRPPQAQDAADLAEAVADAVANKGREATAAFVEHVVEGSYYDDGGSGKEYLRGVAEYDRISHHELQDVVATAADLVEAEHDKPFGATVRENAVEAAWEAVVTKGQDGDDAESPLAPDLYPLVDEATSTQKDDATVQGVADRLARKFENAEDGRHRASRATLRRYVDRAADATEEYDDATVGETARENVVNRVWEVMEPVPDDPPLVREVGAERDVASELLEAMRETDIMSPPTNCLSPITDEQVEAGLRKEFDADFYAATTRDADVHGGDPFIVEAGIAYGGEIGEEGKAQVMRFANRVPLVYQRGACATTDVVKDIGWRNYGLDQPGGSGIPNGPAVIMVHVASTNVPFTSESKDAVANIPAIEDEIELAIREAARELKSYLNKRRSLEKRRQKQDVIAKILPQMAEKLAETTGKPEPEYGDALARIMNNVLVERAVEENGDDKHVSVTVENHTDSGASPELTDIVSAEPADLSSNATVVEMDGEWFVKWSPFLNSGEDATVEYTVDAGASTELTVEDVESEKLTVQQ